MADEVKNDIEIDDSDRSLPIDLTREAVIEKCEYFSSVGIWPLKSELDPEAWLSNFQPAELNHAIYLLNSFMYFTDMFMDKIFNASLRTLSRLIMSGDDDYQNLQVKWQSFVSKATVTYVTGEIPGPTDSGYQYARKARAYGINQNMIKTPEEVVHMLLNKTEDPIIFVDDFVGSGGQFLATWFRKYDSYSLYELTSISKAPLYLCTGFCTEYAMGELESVCPRLIINPGHLITKDYNALDDDSIIWPSHLKETAVDFIESASARAGIPDTGGSTPEDWRGYAGLGLTIALEGSIPDATLPIFYWEKNGWRPLLRRTNV